MIHAHRKKSTEQAKPQGGHNGAAALGVAGVGAAGYAAHSAMSGSSAPQAGSMLRDSSVIYVCLFLLVVIRLIWEAAPSSRRCPRSALTAFLHRSAAATNRRPSISNRCTGTNRTDMVTPTSIRS